MFKRVRDAFLSVLVLVAVGGNGTAHAEDKISFVTNWTATGEHAGFYQAAATGLYRRYGLDVTIRQGGPQINTAQMLAAGAVDFRMAANSGSGLNYVRQNIPAVVVAAFFQKDPAVLISHPGVDSLKDAKDNPILLNQQAIDTVWPFLKAKFGFTDRQIRPYTFDIAPFLADKRVIQMGYVTNEPFLIEKAGGFKPNVFLIADEAGYNSYSTTLETTRSLIEKKPNVVQRFVDASIEGWYSYLFGDPSPADNLIRKENPEMPADLLAFTRAKIKEYGIVDSGDSLKLGIGAMTDARWKSFFETAASYGLYPANLDYKKAYTLDFVSKGHGVARN